MTPTNEIPEAARPVPEPRAFETWTKGGIRFLSFAGGSGVIVIDQAGRNYGSWSTLARFRELQDAGNDISKPLDSRVMLQGAIRMAGAK